MLKIANYTENTKIELVVTAANNSTRKYIINVTKKKPTEPIEPEPTPDKPELEYLYE